MGSINKEERPLHDKRRAVIGLSIVTGATHEPKGLAIPKGSGIPPLPGDGAPAENISAFPIVQAAPNLEVNLKRIFPKRHLAEFRFAGFPLGG